MLKCNNKISQLHELNKIKNEIVGAKKVGQSDLGCHVRAADGPMGWWADGQPPERGSSKKKSDLSKKWNSS